MRIYKLYIFIFCFFIKFCAYSQDVKIDLIWKGGGEFKKTKITITLQNIKTEKYILYSTKEKVCDLCKNFNNKIIKRKSRNIEKKDFDNLLNALKELNISELEKNNNIDSFLWFPPTMTLILSENGVNIFSIKYVSPQELNKFPISLYPLNKIAKDIFKFAGIKSKKYCVNN